MRRISLIGLALMIAVFGFASTRTSPAEVSAAAPIVVSGTADDAVLSNLAANGTCDLREAITAANTNAAVGECTTGDAGLDTITFNISGNGPHTIDADAAFTIVEPLNLDATTAEQATTCSAGNRQLSIEVKKDSAPLDIFTVASTAQGSTIAGFVISGAVGAAILVTGTNGVTIRCNHLGTSVGGDTRMPNEFGVRVTGSTSNVTIGGSSTSDRNLLSGGAQAGLQIQAGSATVRGNYIGTDLTGTFALHSQNGVVITNATGLIQIGGFGANDGNLISGNAATGLNLGNTPNLRVEGNRIGIASDGDPLPNGGTGVRISGQPGSQITVSRNQIANNGGLGIDLGVSSGITPNDAGDVDTGPNNLQNFPTLTHAGPGGIQGNTSTFAAGTYTIELFRSPTCDPSGFGEGREWIASLAGVTEEFDFNDTPPILGKGFITATATSSATGATSEFSACMPIIPDVDCDTDADGTDALIVLRQIADLPGAPFVIEPCVTDANGDANVDIRDVLLIRRFAAGL